MGKRKRDQDTDVGTAQDTPRSNTRLLIDRNVAKISSALQLATRFERQKLGRRQKTASAQRDRAAFNRVQDEIEALKTFDIQKASERHLRKILLRIKSIASSEVVQAEEFFQEVDKVQLDKATANLNGRLFKSKGVQEAVDAAVESIKKRIDASLAKDVTINEAENGATLDEEDPSAKRAEGEDEDSDKELLYKYAGRFAASDSEDEDEDNQIHPTRNLSVSLSPSPPPEHSKLKSPVSKSSMFLPSLTEGGYISASHSSASDINDEIAPRKNRRGQRERRAIAEKKYGSSAKHLVKEGQKFQVNGSKAPERRGIDRDAGWDFRRGAVSTKDRKNFSRQKSGSILPRNGDVSAAEKKKTRTRDDQGPLHPSWAARKAAKSKEKMAMRQFSGTKIVFE